MNCNDVQEQLLSFLEGELTVASRTAFDAHFEICQRCREELRHSQTLWESLAEFPKPTAALRDSFYATLEAYQAGAHDAATPPSITDSLKEWLKGLWPRQPVFQLVTGIALFSIGIFVGSQFMGQSQLPLATAEPSTLGQLKGEVASLRQLVMLSLLQNPSANDRLQGVGWTAQLDQANDDVLSALLRTLNHDPNVNVRLAAVEALHAFADRATVRAGLIESIEIQTSPLVQLELIKVMVHLNEKESIPILEGLRQNQDANAAVREGARWGLNELI